MISKKALHFALRARATGTTVATTGTMDLAATTTGYSRLTGSFLTDGFQPGMEVTPSGFVANTVDVITNVSALSLTVRAPRAVEVSASGRSLAVGFPALRAWENERFTRQANRPYVEEDFVPATHEIITLGANNGRAEETGLYVLRVYGVHAYGVNALRDTVDAILARFTPGTTITVTGADVRIRGTARNEPGPQSGQILRDGEWSVCSIRIPWLASTANAIAA